MKNDYKEPTPEELKMQDHAEYYMQLYDYIMKEKPPLQELHDKLCRLIITIAEDYPDSIAENRGKVLRFPKVMAGPTFGGKQEPYSTLTQPLLNPYSTPTQVFLELKYYLTPKNTTSCTNNKINQIQV